MCGRYTLTVTTPDEVASRFDSPAPDRSLVGRFNVAPTQEVAVVRGLPDGGRELLGARWALLPPWARDLKEKVQPINARAEGLADKKLFAPLLGARTGRVLVPADGWYEWLRGEDPKQPRVPFHHVVDDGGPFALAGLLRVRELPELGRVASLAIVTCAANADCARLHDRMPVVLADAEAEAAWLSDGLSATEAQALLLPLADGRVTLRAASPLVNRVGAGHEGPVLLDPEATELPAADADPSAGAP